MRVRSVVTALAASGALVFATASPAFAVTVSPTPGTSSSADGRIENSVEIGGDLYIGGTFTHVDGTVETSLAALNATTGILDKGFNVPVNGEVTSLAASGSTLYIAGSFTTVGGVSRKNVAAIDTTTGKVLAFNPSPSAIVLSVDAANGVVYLGGKFVKVGTTSQPYVAAVDATTGNLVPTFNPRPSASVLVVKAAADGLYVGGNFQTIAGQSKRYIAKLDPITGTAIPGWKSPLPFDTQIFDVAFGDAQQVFLAAGGHLPGGNSVYSVAASDGTKKWQVQMDGNLQSVEYLNGTVYGGGHFGNLDQCNGGTCSPVLVRKKAVAIDASSGLVRDWAPKFNTPFGIFDFTVAGGNLYALGDFTKVNGTNRLHIARFPI